MQALSESSIRTLRSLFGENNEAIEEVLGGVFSSHISRGVSAELHLTALIRDRFLHQVYLLEPAQPSTILILGPAPVVVLDVRGTEATYWVRQGDRLTCGALRELRHLLRHSERLVARARPPLSPTPDGGPRRQGMSTAEAIAHAQAQPVVQPLSLEDHYQMMAPGRPLPGSDHPGPSGLNFKFGPRTAPEVQLPPRLEQANARFDRVQVHAAPNAKHEGGFRPVSEARKEEEAITRALFRIQAQPSPDRVKEEKKEDEKKKEKKGFGTRVKGLLTFTRKEDDQPTAERARSELHDEDDFFVDSPGPLLTSPLRRKRRSSDDDGDEDGPANEPKRQRRQREEEGDADMERVHGSEDGSIVDVVGDPDVEDDENGEDAPGQAPATQPAPGAAVLLPVQTPPAAATAPAGAPVVVDVSEDIQLPDKHQIKNTVQAIPDTTYVTHHKDIKEMCDPLVFSKKMSIVTTTSARRKTVESLERTFDLLVYHPMTREQYNQLAYELNQIITRLAHLVQLGEKFNRFLKRRMERAAGGRRGKVAFNAGMEARYDAFKAYGDRLRRDMEELNGELNGY